MYSSDESFQRSREGLLWCLFPELRSNEGNKYQNNTRVSAETVRHESAYSILFLTRHNESINEYKTTSFTHCPRVPLARFSFCWWRHNGLLMTSQWWPDNCDEVMWILISNSLDIDYIHGDICDQSCKKFDLTHWGRDKMETIFRRIFDIDFLENLWILIKISLKFVPRVPIAIIWTNDS